QVLNLRSTDAFIRITGVATVPDPDGNQDPVELTYVLGPWLERFRHNPQVLQRFGDVRRIAKIPGGRPGGSWAHSIAFALNPFWREGASRATRKRGGEEKQDTLRFPPVTRRELLTMIPPEPSLEDVINSGHPGRAKQYWHRAMRFLKDEKIVGY